ncbi:type IV secretion system DNA-binding domain-containing protein [Candidatus Nomurabacteria bacterium]|nr:MAG: type IV secretion system DNA-binding domain-containing protein [Candidatus Nomurabacteria bacterium]
MQPTFNELPKFQTPEEELTYLREHVARREQELKEQGTPASTESVAKEAIASYKEIPQEQVLTTNIQVTKKEIEGFALPLTPEPHDTKMEELLGVLLSRGVKVALEMANGFHNPHIDDDFHRFLAQYLIATHAVPGLKDGTPIFKGLNMSLFEITLPPVAAGKERGFKELLGAMEQFYAGMQSVASDTSNKTKEYYTIEIALSSASDEVIIYAAIPAGKGPLFEKQVFAFYTDAKIREITDDYNIFNANGSAAGAFATLAESDALPIKMHDTLDHDPMNSILNVFTKMKRVGEGAAIQFVIAPAGDKFIKRFTSMLADLKDGMTIKESADKNNIGAAFLSASKDLIFGGTKKEKEKKIDDNAVTKVGEKIKSTIVVSGIRIIASAETKERANNILSELESAFNQFAEPNSNKFIFNKINDRKLAELFHAYSYRLYEESIMMPLNFTELSTVFHFPMGVGNPQLKEAKAGIAPAPVDMSTDGILLGYNEYRGMKTPVHMKREDRMRHFYVIGQTGTGKTGILKSMIAQDIKNGEGCCFIDPHGNDVQDILSYVPKERIDDVIYFDPAYIPRPMALNMLEYDPRFPEQKTMVIDTLMLIFNQLFDMKTGGGPMFEQYFKNSAYLVMDHLESGSTLLEITRVLADKSFRDMKLSHCKNPIVKQFWAGAEATTGDQGLANFVPYVTSKFDVFISNEFMRPVVLQEKSVLNFRDIMDNKKILLVNLSKGRLGELNANLIGMLIVMKLQMAALSRVDSYGKTLADFYLYIDEFQNVTTPAIASILSEARKYRLSLNMAHQYIAQLPEDIKGAVFGNVGSMAVFRVSPEDAGFLESKFAPTFTAQDITKLDNRNAYMSMIINGAPSLKPFNIVTADFPKADFSMVDKLKELSYLKYGSDREEVEAAVFAKFDQSR